jgi:hypothetical protein
MAMVWIKSHYLVLVRHVFMVCCITKHRDNYALPYLNLVCCLMPVYNSSSVSIVAQYWLDDRGSISGRGWDLLLFATTRK